MQKVIIHEALKAYQLYLQAGGSQFEESERNAVIRCSEYLENGGEANENWLRENEAIRKAVTYFYKQLDEKLEEATAKDMKDYNLITVLRIEQRNVSKLQAQMDDLHLQSSN